MIVVLKKVNGVPTILNIEAILRREKIILGADNANLHDTRMRCPQTITIQLTIFPFDDCENNCTSSCYQNQIANMNH